MDRLDRYINEIEKLEKLDNELITFDYIILGYITCHHIKDAILLDSEHSYNEFIIDIQSKKILSEEDKKKVKEKKNERKNIREKVNGYVNEHVSLRKIEAVSNM